MNAYIAYRTYCKDQNIKPLTQYEFRKSIALAWLKPEMYWRNWYNNQSTNKRKVDAQNEMTSSKKRRRSLNTQSSMSTTTTTSSKTGRAPRLTGQSLDPTSGSLRIRLKVGPGMHLIHHRNMQSVHSATFTREKEQKHRFYDVQHAT